MSFFKHEYTKDTSNHAGKLPIALIPHKGEALGGWYARISLGYAVTLHSALPVINLQDIEGERIDTTIIEELSHKLFGMTDVPKRVWWNMIKEEAKLTNMWLKYQPETEYCFPQLPNYYCIECFLEDMETIGQTYYRVKWSSPFVLSCHKHRSPLINNRFISYENVNCKFDSDKFVSRVNYVGKYEIVSRWRTRISGNFISPMARRVSDLFSLNDKIAKRALKELGRYKDLDVARSAALAVLQILSFRSRETEMQCIGRILFYERHSKEFPECRGYNRWGLVFTPKENLTTCFEQVGWFICHPKKYKRYGLEEYSRLIVSAVRGVEATATIPDTQLVIICD